jgi:ATP-binding cassette subfamily B multidrug efflux pump
MLRLKKYYLPYLKFILPAILFVLVVAWSDLQLPDYLSDIVNIGIQQKGVESGAPVVLSESTFQRIGELYPDEQAKLLQYYELVAPGSPQSQSLATDFPKAAEEAVYALKPLDETQKLIVEDLISKPLVFIQSVRMIQQDPARAAQMLGENFPIDPNMISSGQDLLSVLSMMPQAQRAQVLDQVNQHLASLEGTILHQITISAITSEYSALNADTGHFQTNYILRIGAQMLAVSLTGLIASLVVSYLASLSSANVARDLRSGIFRKVTDFTNAEFESFSTASLITRTTNDVDQVRMASFMLIRMGVQAPLIGVLGIVRALEKSPGMWWTIALIVGTLMSVIIGLFIIVVPRFKRIQTFIDKLNLVMRENLSGIMVVRAFNKQKYEEARFDVANKDLTSNMLFIGRAMSFMFPIMNLIMMAGQVFIIWIGAGIVAQSKMQVGDLIAFMQYAMQIMFSFMNLSMLFVFIPRAGVSANRIADVLEKPVSITDPAQPVAFEQPVRGVVEFHDVDFRYPDAEEDILHDVSFTAEPGKVTAIIGSTGSGKSTLINLLPRFFDVTKGKITIDDIDIRDVPQATLREQIGYAPQKGLLFSGTVATNLQVAKPDATEEEMREALTIAQAADFVLDGEDGLNMPIAQGGDNVSGGQRQRLSIARAIIKPRPIYIFDDSFSALDFKTDSALRSALRPRVANSTFIIITQRVSTAKNSDQVIVLDNGRAVGKGSHQYLMANCPTYQEIASSQLSAEELA